MLENFAMHKAEGPPALITDSRATRELLAVWWWWLDMVALCAKR
jgi:hypothetical protein